MSRAVLGIVLLDHGSRRAESNAQLDELAARVAARRPDAVVRAAHMELAEPSLARAIDACALAGATRIVIHPYFLAPGRHTREDIPRLVSEAAAGHPEVEIATSEPLGLHDKLVDVVLERIAGSE